MTTSGATPAAQIGILEAMSANDPNDDPLWSRLRREAQELQEREDLLKPLARASVLDRTSFPDALASVLSSRLCEHALPAVDLHRLFEPLLSLPAIAEASRRDLAAVVERDPAAHGRALVPFLHFKGFQSLQAHRIAHHLWTEGRLELALHLQGRIALVYGVDFHPAARIGSGIMIDHATGVVVGETAVIGNDVSMLHGVTLGGTGKDSGDRHPKVGHGVLLGSGAKILGNVKIGDGSKIGAGSVVLADVPPHCTVVGVPARVVGRPRCEEPGLLMDQHIEEDTEV